MRTRNSSDKSQARSSQLPQLQLRSDQDDLLKNKIQSGRSRDIDDVENLK
jgi:hypothetical protein